MTPRHYGSLASGESVEAYTLANEAGASVEVLSYGGIVTSLCMPDRDARIGDVVLGFNGLDDYLDGSAYIGAIVGRIAGRVSGGQISLEGRTYELARNDGPNHLHGGRRGLDKRGMEGSSGVPSRRRLVPSPFLPEPGRRGGLPGKHRHLGDLHADVRERVHR